MFTHKMPRTLAKKRNEKEKMAKEDTTTASGPRDGQNPTPHQSKKLQLLCLRIQESSKASKASPSNCCNIFLKAVVGQKLQYSSKDLLSNSKEKS